MAMAYFCMQNKKIVYAESIKNRSFQALVLIPIGGSLMVIGCLEHISRQNKRANKEATQYYGC